MDWKKEKEQYCKGWHTWNNDSIMSYICPLDGRGIRLCIKDYKNAAFLENVLIGDSDAKVIPLAHAYDDSFTHVIVEWKDNHFEVQTATVGEELYVLLKCEDQRMKSSSLIIQGLSLYNLGASIRKYADKEKACLILESGNNRCFVYSTAEENGELYVPLCTPYLSVDLQGEIGISTNAIKSVEEIKCIIEDARNAYYANSKMYGDKSELYRAMQIAQAWDTIYDPIMRAPITTVSRIWNKQW